MAVAFVVNIGHSSFSWITGSFWCFGVATGFMTSEFIYALISSFGLNFYFIFSAAR